MKKSILVIAYPCVHSGGAERWWFKVLETVAKEFRNVELHIAVPLDIKPGCLVCSRKISGSGSSSSDIIYLYMKHPIAYIKSLVKIIRLIKQKGIHIIVSGYQTLRIALLTYIASFITGRRCYIVFHTPLGWLPYYKDANVKPVHAIIFKIFELMNKRCPAIYVSKAIVYDHKRVNVKLRNYVWLSGSALPIEPPPMKSVREWLFDIVYLASIAKHKGILDIPAIVQKVAEHIPNVKVAIIGRMPNPLKDEFLTEIRRRGLENNIILLGYVDGETKFHVLRQSKIMVYPSYMDTFAIAVLEALSVGTPVIAYKIPAIALCYPTKAVIKVRTGDIYSLAKEAVKLLKSEDLRKELSREAVQFSKLFSWNKIAKELMNIITK